MNRLNKTWIALVVLGILVLIGSIVFRLQLASEDVDSFNVTINQLTSNRIFNPEIEEHFRGDLNFNQN